jgi:hypothetical protein
MLLKLSPLVLTVILGEGIFIQVLHVGTQNLRAEHSKEKRDLNKTPELTRSVSSLSYFFRY